MAYSIGDAIEIALHMHVGADKVMNVWTYELSGVVAPTVQSAHIAEAWWQHMKASYRATIAVGFGALFDKVSVKSLMSATGDSGEWAIPSGEQAGTRSNPAGDFAPQFTAAGSKLIVPSRLTRPGAKRFIGLYEADTTFNFVGSAFIALVNAVHTVQLPNFVLGAPAATVQLNPVVVRKDSSGLASTWQQWNSFLVNPYVTTQNTRKVGRGS